MRHYYFAYGANTNLNSMAQRCPGAECIGPSVLEGYRFTFRQHADVELDDDCNVNGVLWLLDDDHMYSLDAFEGFPNYYLRCKAWVRVQNTYVKAWIYFMQDQDYVAMPAKSYLDVCRAGYKHNGIDTFQIDEALETITNLDLDRQDYYVSFGR